MAIQNWEIKKLLSIGEDILYNCEIEDEDNTKNVLVCITNYRIIWIQDSVVECYLLKAISKYGIFVGYDDYGDETDIGKGEYGLYFGDNTICETIWFYSKDVCMNFYEELSRAIFNL